MKKTLAIISIIIIILALILSAYFIFRHQEDSPDLIDINTTNTTTYPIILDNIKEGDYISSPLSISGQALGTWFFEASFPVILLDAHGNVLAQTPTVALTDWMTTDYVPFEVELLFVKPEGTAFGTLVFKKDNPSGLPENKESWSILVSFK